MIGVRLRNRAQQMQDLHQLLQQSEQLAITAATGMGGIGKTFVREPGLTKNRAVFW